MPFLALQAEAVRLLELTRDQEREIMSLRSRLKETGERLQSIALESQVRCQEMLGKRFSEMRPLDIPVFDPRFRAMMLFSEYQEYKKVGKNDITRIDDKSHKRMRDIMDDIRKENEMELFAKKGIPLGSSRSGERKRERRKEETKAAAGVCEVPDQVEVSPEFAAALGLKR